MSRRRTKSKTPIVIIGAVIILLAAGAFLFFSDFFESNEETEYSVNETANTQFNATHNRQQHSEYVAHDLTITLDAILGRTNEQGYIMGFPTLGTEPLFNDDEIAEKMNAAITYEVMGVHIDGTIATATIFVSAPDLSIILRDAVSLLLAGDSDDVNELLAIVSAALNLEHEVFENTFEVYLELLDGNWFLVPNAEFSNALSGNLIQLYAQMVEVMIQDMMGGNSNE